MNPQQADGVWPCEAGCASPEPGVPDHDRPSADASDGAGVESRGGGNGVEVVVDHELCSRAAYCQGRYPAVFEVVGDYAEVRADVAWSDIDRALLEETARGCPWMAIEVTATRDPA